MSGIQKGVDNGEELKAQKMRVKIPKISYISQLEEILGNNEIEEMDGMEVDEPEFRRTEILWDGDLVTAYTQWPGPTIMSFIPQELIKEEYYENMEMKFVRAFYFGSELNFIISNDVDKICLGSDAQIIGGRIIG